MKGDAIVTPSERKSRIYGGDLTHGVSPEAGAAWELTRRLSPRGSVRVDADGTNDYWLTHRVDDDAPATPWAMNLTTPDGRYRYLSFDLDAKNGNAAYDAGRLSHWLDELNIDHLVCVSGPTGGRHVWLSLDEHGAPAEIVGTIAHLASQLLPSLDTTPLRNPATGSVRPPFTPHRRGGRSEPQSPVDVLLAHTVGPDELAALEAFLVDAGATVAPVPQSLVKGMAHDSEGRPYLIGAKRDISARIRELLNAAPADDTSRTQGAVLVGCARARWRYADVAALLDVSPALEHARSRPAPGGRLPRPRAASEKLLEADWTRAVYYAAHNPLEHDGDDEEFVERAIAASAAVAACQERADASPGRWGLDAASRAQRASQGRYSHRAVLDAACLYLVQAARSDVEVDIRRLSAETGYGREACRLALLALSTPDTEGDVESSWLVRVADAHDVHGARFRLSERFSTGRVGPEWSQAAMRPSPQAAPADAQRTWWINRLASKLHLLAQDTFAAPGSLGRTAGRAYASLPEEGAADISELSAAAGMTAHQVRRALHRLHQAGLAERGKSGWHRSTTIMTGIVAIAIGVDGYVLERSTRYDIERGVWAWWSAECAWMRKRRKKRRGRRAPTGVALFSQNDRPDYTKYPRSPTGRPDHAQARALVEAGILSASRVDQLAA